jgi:hypothetical protein
MKDGDMIRKNEGIIQMGGGGIWADQLVVGRDGSAVKTVQDGAINASRNETINITNSSNINIKSTLDRVNQSVNAIPASSESDKRELQGLLKSLNELLQTIPPHKANEAEAVAEQVAHLVDAATKSKPNRTMLQVIGNGLTQTAAFLKEVAPGVITISAQIIKIVGNIHGIPL